MFHSNFKPWNFAFFMSMKVLKCPHWPLIFAVRICNLIKLTQILRQINPKVSFISFIAIRENWTFQNQKKVMLLPNIMKRFKISHVFGMRRTTYFYSFLIFRYLLTLFSPFNEYSGLYLLCLHQGKKQNRYMKVHR